MMLQFFTLICSFNFETRQTKLYITGDGTLSSSEVLKHCDKGQITEIYIGEGCIGFEAGTFFNFNALKVLHFPSTLKTTTGSDTRYCPQITNFYINSTNPYLEVDQYGALYTRGKERLIRVPTQKEQYIFPSQTKIIGEQAFEMHQKYIEITIPNTVTTIENGWIYDSCITKVFMQSGSTITYIGDWSWAPTVWYILIAKSVKTLYQGAFSNCYALNIIEFEQDSDLELIESNVFSNTVLGSLRLPQKFKHLDANALYPDNFLTYVYIPASLTNINENAFTGCPNINSIEIDINNSNYIVIGSATLMTKDQSKFIYIPNDLVSFEIPEKIATFGQTIFQSCSNLTTLTVSPNNNFLASDDGIVYSKDYYTAVACMGGCVSTTINSQYRTIGSYCFKFCNKLENVVLNENLITLGNNAFERVSSLKEISIPSTVLYIFDYCFYSSAVSKVIINGDGPDFIGE